MSIANISKGNATIAVHTTTLRSLSHPDTRMSGLSGVSGLALPQAVEDRSMAAGFAHDVVLSLPMAGHVH